MSTPTAQPAPRAFAVVFGLLMIGACAVEAYGWALAAVGVSVAALVVSVWLRVAATVAVLAIVVALALSGPEPIFAVLSGLCATAYLLTRHAAGGPRGLVTTTRPVLLAMMVFAALGAGAAWVAVPIRWVPVVAAPAVVIAYALVVLPYFRHGGSIRL
ncbi:hypothetical protein FOS14_17770 [Skermania sp. ID1734]|uniref:hypothetical protein n=1 Tax=Skermania sp. ID1734 TaxID=2597516 RepID=UPI001181235C|nr:hypothetical protein [Skermania sp. ID1734]TSD95649.1 hypothetical protein FOS14_17770 [Skermania sp. ID1734]